MTNKVMLCLTLRIVRRDGPLEETVPGITLNDERVRLAVIGLGKAGSPITSDTVAEAVELPDGEDAKRLAAEVLHDMDLAGELLRMPDGLHLHPCLLSSSMPLPAQRYAS